MENESLTNFDMKKDEFLKLEIMKKTIWTISLIASSVILIALFGGFGKASFPKKYESSQMAKLPMPMMFPKIVQGNGKYYVITQGNSEKFRINMNLAGAVLPDSQVMVYEFNPGNATLRKLADAPFVRNFFGVCLNGNKIYVAGGYDANWKSTKTVFELDLLSKKWTAKKDMTVGRSRFSFECVNGQLYAIGGEGILGPGESFHPESNSWVQLKTRYIPVKSQPVEVVSCSAVIDDKIFIFGKNAEVLHIYSSSEDVMTEGPAAPFKSEDFDAAVFSKRLYIAGGKVAGVLDGSVRMFDRVEGNWSTVGRSPMPRYGAGLVYFNSMLMFLGGALTNPSAPVVASDDIYIYRPMR
jgi:hypothetical protein